MSKKVLTALMIVIINALSFGQSLSLILKDSIAFETSIGQNFDTT